MFFIEIKNLPELIADVDGLIKDRIPKMTAMALTEMAKKLKEAAPAEMERVFDRPNPWTLGGVDYQMAYVNDLKAYVWIKDWGAGLKTNTPAAKYLLPEVMGGPRNLKRFERALQAAGVMPSGMYAMPGAGAKLDAYGNMDRGQLIQILSYFQAFREVGSKANMTEKKKASLAKGSKRAGRRGFEYFVGVPGSDGIPRPGKDFKSASKLPLGVWQRTAFGPMGSAIKPVLIFTKKAPVYQPRFKFFEWSQAFVDREFPGIFERIVNETLAYRRGV